MFRLGKFKNKIKNKRLILLFIHAEQKETHGIENKKKHLDQEPSQRP